MDHPPTAQGTPPAGADDEVDQCVCGLDLHASEATPDADLPPASGGIEAGGAPPHDESLVDGCDVDFKATEPTLDEELPFTVGGT
jgi:hypothetical protein